MNVLYIPKKKITFTVIKIGLFYNYYVATDSRNIAPLGWHVPSIQELTVLIAYLGGSSIAGGKLKETGYSYWVSPNTGATNEVGFNGRGNGARNIVDGAFSYSKSWSYIWLSDINTLGTGFYMGWYTDDIYINNNQDDYNWGMGIRWIKDNSINPKYVVGNNGNIYPTVKIGDQVWTACNVAETKYRNGDTIPEVTDNATWIALTSDALCAPSNNWDFV